MPPASGKFADLALLLLLSTLWGAAFTFIKIGIATIPPVTLIAVRTLIAVGILLAIMRWRGITLPRDRDTWRQLAIQALLNSVVPYTLIAWGEHYVDAGLTTILNSCSPILAFLGTWAITRHETVTPRKLFGVAAGLGGVCLIIGVDAFHGMGDRLLPQLAIVLAAVCYGAAAIYGRNFSTLDPMVPAAGSLLCGAVIMIPLSLVVDRPWALAPSADSLLALAGLAVFSTALAFVIYFRLIRTLGTVGTTAQAYLRVPIGVAVGVVFLGESLTTTAWIGLACVVAGVAAMTLPSRAAPRPAR